MARFPSVHTIHRLPGTLPCTRLSLCSLVLFAYLFLWWSVWDLNPRPILPLVQSIPARPYPTIISEFLFLPLAKKSPRPACSPIFILLVYYIIREFLNTIMMEFLYTVTAILVFTYVVVCIVLKEH